jgi:hypothetical protein
VKPRMGKAVQRDADRVLDFRIERENGEEELFQLKFRKSAPPTAEVIEGVLDSLMNESKVKADLAALRARLAQLEKALSGDLLFSDAGPAPTGSPPVLAELFDVVLGAEKFRTGAARRPRRNVPEERGVLWRESGTAEVLDGGCTLVWPAAFAVVRARQFRYRSDRLFSVQAGTLATRICSLSTGARSDGPRPREQLGDIVNIDAERGGDLLEGLDRTLACSSFDLRDVGRRKTCRLGKCLDSQAAILAPDP